MVKYQTKGTFMLIIKPNTKLMVSLLTTLMVTGCGGGDTGSAQSSNASDGNVQT